MNNNAYVIGHQHEAINTCLWLASMNQTVYLLADEPSVLQTLEYYQCDHQMNTLWQLYCVQQKINHHRQSKTGIFIIGSSWAFVVIFR
ncbi:UDP-glucose dehydrogenase [Moraxella catarrhalis]|nr:hypothetical protein [Moraxella catarrhalis]OAV05812.1 UDP-glucose dehydrogenase [Moraxella catarrhalis]